MMQMLRAGGVPVFTDDFRPPDPDNPHGYLEHAAVRSIGSDASWLVRAEGRAVKVVVPLLCDLPSDRAYRVIVMRRPIGEILASQARMLERRGRAVDPDSEGRLAVAFGRQLARTEAWLAEHPGIRALHPSHSDLLRDPERTAARVAEFLGADLDHRAMVACIDPSLWRSRD